MIAKKVARNFVSLFVSNVIGQLFTFWAVVHIARVFGPEGFGKFSFAQVIALYFLYLADFGLQTLGTRSIAQGRTEIHKHLWSITALRFLLGVACFVLLIGVAAILPKPSDVRSLVVVFGLAIIPTALTLEWVFQGIEEMEYVGLGRILKGASFAGLVVLFVRTPEHLHYAAVFYVAGAAVAAAVLFAVTVRRFGLIRTRLDLTVLKETVVAAVPLAVGTFIAQVNYNFGTFTLGLFQSDEVVGLFSAAYKVPLFLWAFVVVAAANAVLPVLARSYTQSTTLLAVSLKKLLRLFVFVGIPIGIGGTILAPEIMEALYSAEYSKATIVLQLSIWTVVIVIYRVTFENALIASKSRRDYFIGYLVAGTMTVVGNLLLVPAIGLVAPSIVGILSESALLLYFVRSCRFVRPSYVINISVKPLFAGILMGAVLVFLQWNVFAVLTIGMVAYIALLFLFGWLTREDVSYLVLSLAR